MNPEMFKSVLDGNAMYLRDGKRFDGLDELETMLLALGGTAALNVEKERSGVLDADAVSHRNACRASRLDAFSCVSLKACGYASGYSLVLLSPISGLPVACIEAHSQCSRKDCTRYGTKLEEFVTCANCLTTYCSKWCQIRDWATHGAACRSELAYTSMAAKWLCGLPHRLVVCRTESDQAEFRRRWLAWLSRPTVATMLTVSHLPAEPELLEAMIPLEKLRTLSSDGDLTAVAHVVAHE